MRLLALAVCVSSFWPIWRDWKANRKTSLSHAMYWLWLTWAAWCGAIALDLADLSRDAVYGFHYFALCLTGCTGIAVFGARQPGAAAWNFVVLGLLVVNLLPLAEGLTTANHLQLSGLRIFAIGVVLAAGILNYLPTRMGEAALLLLAACGVELAWLFEYSDGSQVLDHLKVTGVLALGAAAWLAFVLACIRQKAAGSEFDRTWYSFRDRFGFVWSERLRQQFNRSAYHHGWPVSLRGDGLHDNDGRKRVDAPPQEMWLTLIALMKRFGTASIRD
jgi:hypothetical protein